ncbi:amino acid ABC transporter permease [Mycetohabitans sp. B46]|uniref:amino acid ABC transporter permease n=1 Tax=Mycetohabitans sp. B46 TaxID=2772536 RepID=UPI00307F5CC0
MDVSILLDNLPYLLVGTFPNGPLGGVALTLVLALTSAFASGVLGLAGGVALAVTRGVVHTVLLAVLGFFRAIPVLMLIFWTYFLLPIVLHIDAPGQLTVVCALSLIGGAYLSHAVHAGIRAVGTAQLQAGLSLGFTRMQALRFVVLPQALRIMAPSFINQWVSLIKDTSLAYIVGVPELSLLATQVNNRLMVYPAQIFALVAFIYVLICTAFDALASRLIAVATPRPLR